MFEHSGVAFLVVFESGFTVFGASNPDIPEPGDLRAAGTVDFPVSCTPAVQAEFTRGVALLHSFFYEEARRIFTGVAAKDPTCAMAQWGIAMTWWHPIWTPPTSDEMSLGKAAVDKAMAMEAGTDRERHFITALNAYYSTPDGPATGEVGQSCHGPVGPRDRVIAYEKAMRKLRERFPDDFETQTFYALAVLAVGYANPTDTTLSNQLEAARILEKLGKKNPQHPGVAHYLIHSYDYPALAERGLAAARSYSSIAPWVPHALHMPSHIFTRIGAWEDSVATNVRSEDIARAESSGDEALHAIDYQVYAYLQMARDADAKKAVERGDDYAARFSFFRPPGPFGQAAAPARYALERGDWKSAAQLPVKPTKILHAMAITHFARAVGAARAGDSAAAQADLARLAELRDNLAAAKSAYWAGQVDIQWLGASAWTALAEGRRDEALKLMRSAADKETASEKAPISPGPILPARELLGDMLLELGQPALALSEYEASQQREPNRFRGLYGAATAAARSGDSAKAKTYFEKLAALAQRGDSRPELQQARSYLAVR